MSKILDYVRLSSKVIVVAVEGEVGDWAAYIDAVPGERDGEEKQVARNGTKIRESLAREIFPQYASHLVWRD